MQRAHLLQLNALRAAKTPALSLASLSDGVIAIYAAGQTQALLWQGQDLTAEAEAALREDRPRTIEAGGATLFLNPYNPPLRLIIVGAVHIAQALARLAQLADFEVCIIDPRTAFASPARFPDAVLHHDWPDEALAALRPDRRTAVVTLTHDPKLDDPALMAALGSPAFYIGALGSKKTHAARLDRLRQGGCSDRQLGRIDGPAGLAIGAKSPAEIAFSVMAAMIQALRQPQPQPQQDPAS